MCNCSKHFNPKAECTCKCDHSQERTFIEHLEADDA
jgi:hypothetical protein